MEVVFTIKKFSILFKEYYVVFWVFFFSQRVNPPKE
jgi:hypothetical protein